MAKTPHYLCSTFVVTVLEHDGSGLQKRFFSAREAKRFAVAFMRGGYASSAEIDADCRIFTCNKGRDSDSPVRCVGTLNRRKF